MAEVDFARGLITAVGCGFFVFQEFLQFLLCDYFSGAACDEVKPFFRPTTTRKSALSG